MHMQRRHFMRLGLAGSALLPSFVLGASLPQEALQWLRIGDDWAAPVAAAGDWLAVDVGITAFAGEGLYLYPAWGTPRAYLVRALPARPGQSAGYEFCNPASGRVLWTDTGRVDFAGRVCGRVPAQVEAWLGQLPALPPRTVPRLPA